MRMNLEDRLNENPELKRQFGELDAYMNEKASQQGSLINVMHRAQEIFGYLPDDVLDHVSIRFHVPRSTVYGVVTFYHFFSRVPKGRHTVSVCLGTACYVRGDNSVYDKFMKTLGIKAGETSGDGRFSLDLVRCVGACGLAPVIVIDKDTYGRMTADRVSTLLNKYA
jgi:NADH:ubiquinone oxidoreductase subunit E